MVGTAEKDRLKGEVGSEQEKCEPGRKVEVYRQVGGTPATDALIGTDKTNRKGKYVVVPDGDFASPGEYYARVKPTDTCKGARSAVMRGPG